MTEIPLAFLQEIEELLRQGKKHATTRRSRHGSPGDTFRAAGAVWRITSIVPLPLGQAFATVWNIEGFDSPAGMREAWERAYNLLHPPDDTQLVYVHFFVREVPP
jgi:hypothetical protein